MHLNISKKTKIVCTIGPASDNAEMVRKLYDAGMTVMRINFSHGTYESAEAKIKLARDLEKEGILVPVALDTKGPEIRTGYMEGDKIEIPDGHIMRITMEEVLGTKEKFSVTYKGLYGDVKVGDHILIDDGNLDFEIIEKDEKAKELVVQAKNAHILKNQKGRNKTAYAAGNYIGKKYLLHAGLIWNSIDRAENGGILDNTMVRDTTVDVREIDVALSSASNKYSKRTVFLDQTYRIPFSFIENWKHRGDTSWVRKDTLDKDLTSAFIGTESEWSVYNKMYKDEVGSSDLAGRAFYNDQFYINPSKSADSLHTVRLDNRVFLRFQPWHEDAVVSKVEGGIGDRYQTFYRMQPGSYLRKPDPVKWNSVYAYAGAEGRLSRYLDWDALGKINFAGTEAGDFLLAANARLSVFPFHRQPKSPISITGRFETSLKEPDFYEQHLYANHFKWDNDFSKTSTTKVEAALDIPRWRLHASAGYALLAGNIYYDTLGVVRQNAEAMSILTAALRKDFKLGILRLDNRALFQLSSKPDVVPLPRLVLNLRWYLQFPIVREDVLQMQVGVDARYNTKWYAPGFNPVTGTFYNQREEEYGACPYFDAFINMQWKQACIFIKMENAGQGWPNKDHDYFSAHHYIHPARIFKVGIYWPFYPSLGSNRKMSERASSGLGGGGGSSGGGGGLRGGLGNMMGGR